MKEQDNSPIPTGSLPDLWPADTPFVQTQGIEQDEQDIRLGLLINAPIVIGALGFIWWIRNGQR